MLNEVNFTLENFIKQFFQLLKPRIKMFLQESALDLKFGLEFYRRLKSLK